MRTIFFSHFGMNKLQRSGFFILILLIILSEIFIRFDFFRTEEKKNYSFSEEELNLLSEIKSEDSIKEKVALSYFNPNSLDENGFMELGFSEKQAKSIIRNRNRLGGNFSTIEEFGETYVISDKKFEELKPYIQLSFVNAKRKQATQKPQYYQKQKSKFKKANPNDLDINGWINFGFSDKQAKSILKYKNSLPKKSFENIAQIKAAYVISDWKFNQIKPYLILPKRSNKSVLNEKILDEFHVNKMSKKEWIESGFSKEEANNIVKCREFKIKFKSIEDIETCPKIDLKKLKKISSKIIFN